MKPSGVSGAWILPSITRRRRVRAVSLTEQTAESYAATFDSNVLGVLLSMKHELRVMLPRGNGSIVNVIIDLRKGRRRRRVQCNVASKHAVEGLTKSAALEVAGTGVRVNVVAPGTTDTGMLTRFTNTDDNKGGTRLDRAPQTSRDARGDRIMLIAFVASARCVIHDRCIDPCGWSDER